MIKNLRKIYLFKNKISKGLDESKKQKQVNIALENELKIPKD